MFISSKMQFALVLVCVVLPSLANALSALWPAARYAGSFSGEPMVDSSEFEKREAFPAFFMGGQQKRSSFPDYVDIAPVMLAGAKDRRASFSAEEDRWMKAMDNLRKPRFG